MQAVKTNRNNPMTSRFDSKNKSNAMCQLKKSQNNRLTSRQSSSRSPSSFCEAGCTRKMGSLKNVIRNKKQTNSKQNKSIEYSQKLFNAIEQFHINLSNMPLNLLVNHNNSQQWLDQHYQTYEQLLYKFNCHREKQNHFANSNIKTKINTKTNIMLTDDSNDYYQSKINSIKMILENIRSNMKLLGKINQQKSNGILSGITSKQYTELKKLNYSNSNSNNNSHSNIHSSNMKSAVNSSAKFKKQQTIYSPQQSSSQISQKQIVKQNNKKYDKNISQNTYKWQKYHQNQNEKENKSKSKRQQNQQYCKNYICKNQDQDKSESESEQSYEIQLPLKRQTNKNNINTNNKSVQLKKVQKMTNVSQVISQNQSQVLPSRTHLLSTCKTEQNDLQHTSKNKLSKFQQGKQIESQQISSPSRQDFRKAKTKRVSTKNQQQLKTNEQFGKLKYGISNLSNLMKNQISENTGKKTKNSHNYHNYHNLIPKFHDRECQQIKQIQQKLPFCSNVNFNQIKPLLYELNELKSQLKIKNQQIQKFLVFQQQYESIVELLKKKQNQSQEAIRYSCQRIKHLQNIIQKYEGQINLYRKSEQQMKDTLRNQISIMNVQQKQKMEIESKLKTSIQINEKIKRQFEQMKNKFTQQIMNANTNEKKSIQKMQIYKQKYYKILHQDELKKIIIGETYNGKAEKIKQIWGILAQHKKGLQSVNQTPISKNMQKKQKNSKDFKQMVKIYTPSLTENFSSQNQFEQIQSN